MSGKNVFLFLTDKESDGTFNNFRNFHAATRELGETYMLFHQKEGALPERLKDKTIFPFTYETLMEMKYLPIGANMVPGSNHFPLLKFFQHHPEFDQYWLIEDDVRFTGDWSSFFIHFSKADHDFLSTHLRHYEQEPQWAWWASLWHPNETFAPGRRIRSFNPIYRISRRGLEFIHTALLAYWIGHHEVLLPTLLYHNGFSIADIGGNGPFVLQGHENLFYTSDGSGAEGLLSTGTMRFRPSWDGPGMEKNKLYHPVKENYTYV
jgi:hypothetical protein